MTPLGVITGPRRNPRLPDVPTAGELGLTDVGRMGEYPGVWVEPNGPRPRKIAAIGVRVGNGSTQRRTMHGFALNVTTDLTYMREHIVPCGIAEYAVTSLAEEGIAITMRDAVDVVARHVATRFATSITRADVAALASTSALTSASTLRICSSFIGSLCEKSKRVLPASTSEPFCCTCEPSTSRSALCIRCVAE